VEVRSIGQEEFRQAYPYTGKMTAFIGEGVEWLADDARTVVGIITRHSIQPEWNYAVLKRNVLGDFQVTHVGKASNDLEIVQKECRLVMMAGESVPETDKTAHSAPQPEPLPQRDKGPLVVLMILAGDITTLAFVLLWLFRCR
jgi:hypothetical protein